MANSTSIAGAMSEGRFRDLLRRLCVIRDKMRDVWDDDYDLPTDLGRVRLFCRHGRLGCLRDLRDRVEAHDLPWRGRRAALRILTRLEAGVTVAVLRGHGGYGQTG